MMAPHRPTQTDAPESATTAHHRPASFFSSRRRHTSVQGDWSSDVCSSDLSTTVSMAARHSSKLEGSSCWSGCSCNGDGMARRAKSSDPIRRTMGESVTVRTKVVVAFFEPLLPLTVRVMTLSPTLESTLMVSTEVLFAGLVANVPVMPSGHPVRDNVTGALKPLAGGHH